MQPILGTLLSGLNEFLLGGMCAGYLVAALFFARFWRDTRDRLFLLFAVAFTVMGLNQVALLMTGEASEFHTLIYGVRLSAFVLILIAIIDKNRPRS